jgi:hypothetical protein
MIALNRKAAGNAAGHAGRLHETGCHVISSQTACGHPGNEAFQSLELSRCPLVKK